MSALPSTPSVAEWLRTEAEPANESYFQLVSRRFLRSRISIVGVLIVIMLTILALFPEFFSPSPIDGDNLKDAFLPPNPSDRVH